MSDQAPADVPMLALGAAPCPLDGTPAVVQWSRRAAGDPEAVVPVHACAAHAITLAAAAHVHRADCPAPDPAVLPECGCTPEPLPPPEPLGTDVMTTLPTGWAVPAP